VGSLKELAVGSPQVTARGPYCLIGWSLGGLIAHAVATRFEKEGERVSLLAVLDAYPYPPDKILEFPTMQAILQGLMKDFRCDPGNGPLDTATVREFLQRDDDALSRGGSHLGDVLCCQEQSPISVRVRSRLFLRRFIALQSHSDLPAKNPNLRHGIDTYVGKSKFMIFTAVIN
jgi:pimeloyl-ACP methyl ester carboxylesterase